MNFEKGFVFKYGWNKHEEVFILGQRYEIIINLHAYYEKDGVTGKQKDAYLNFEEQKTQMLSKIEDALNKFCNNAKERFTPTMLLISRDGEIALLFDDDDNPDDGIAVTIIPEIKIYSQDEYL